MLIPLGTLAAAGSALLPGFEHIITTTVTGSPQNITFTNLNTLAGNYVGLQIRGSIRTAGTGTAGQLILRYNDVADVIYGNSQTGIRGGGSFSNNVNNDLINGLFTAGNDTPTGLFTPFIINIQNPFLSDRVTMTQAFLGAIANTGTTVTINANAVQIGQLTKINFASGFGTTSFVASSRISIYGFKGA